ncbi:hypothetical protein D049_1334B, partial [Vibrio parahaemolyticus VPTS-2010]
ENRRRLQSVSPSRSTSSYRDRLDRVCWRHNAPIAVLRQSPSPCPLT